MTIGFNGSSPDANPPPSTFKINEFACRSSALVEGDPPTPPGKGR